MCEISLEQIDTDTIIYVEKKPFAVTELKYDHNNRASSCILPLTIITSMFYNCHVEIVC